MTHLFLIKVESPPGQLFGDGAYAKPGQVCGFMSQAFSMCKT